jgi:Domain of unknown function (DUF3303)
MLFICYAVIEPQHRDESLKRLRERGTGSSDAVKLLGAWISLTQQESWVIFEADDAAAVMRLWHDWTNLNVNRIEPVMAFEDLMKILDQEY